MKINKILKSIALLSLFIFFGCHDDHRSFGEIVIPTNLQMELEIIGATEENPFGDGSGQVLFSVSADNAISYKFEFGDGRTRTQNHGEYTHTFNVTGVNTFIVTLTANGTGGVKSTISTEVTVFNQFDDPVVKSLLTGDSSKKWYIASAIPAHFGVGPGPELPGNEENFFPSFYAAPANGLATCLYDDEITISLDANGLIRFEHDNAGASFVNAFFVSSQGGGGPDDQCLPVNVSGLKTISLAPADSNVPEEESTGTQMTISDEGFLNYFINQSTYEILEITENTMSVRAIAGPGSDSLAWYFIFTTNPDGTIGEPGSSELETQFNDLIWSEEFDVDGPPDPTIWNYEIGNGADQGIPGWGNQEQQYYTEDNVVVENGTLKITAKAEQFNEFNYTSSRINTLNKFGFNYGRIEVRAKMPFGGGTWPAIWMMGTNFPEIGWPFCGEIDIMEHSGNNQGVVHGTLHFPGNSGGNAVGQTTEVENVSEEFNLYTVEWDENQIIFAVNNQIYHTFQNNAELPFNDDFFIIMNVAMGGVFVGDTIDPNFVESSMEVDYIRVYQ